MGRNLTFSSDHAYRASTHPHCICESHLQRGHELHLLPYSPMCASPSSVCFGLQCPSQPPCVYGIYRALYNLLQVLETWEQSQSHQILDHNCSLTVRHKVEISEGNGQVAGLNPMLFFLQASFIGSIMLSSLISPFC
jgi:hypothetical protein